MSELSKILTLTLPILVPGIILIAILKLHILKFLDFPLDFGQTVNGKRIFGENKTFRGAFIMLFVSILVSHFLFFYYWNGYAQYINPVFSKMPFLIGTLYALAYIAGELVNSFVKRRKNIMPGKTTSSRFKEVQEFFDLSDGILFIVIALLLFTSVPAYQALTAGLIGIFLHYCTDLVMRKLSLKKHS